MIRDVAESQNITIAHPYLKLYYLAIVHKVNCTNADYVAIWYCIAIYP